MRLEVVVASANPAKRDAVEEAFRSTFLGKHLIFYCIEVSSGVPDQPKGDEETLRGAFNRIEEAQRKKPGCDFYVGIEAGVTEIANELHEYAWIVVKSSEGKVGKGKTATFIVPEEVRKLVIEQNYETGHAFDKVFRKSDSKKGLGAIGLLTKGLLNRGRLYSQGVIAALIPFISPEHF